MHYWITLFSSRNGYLIHNLHWLIFSYIILIFSIVKCVFLSKLFNLPKRFFIKKKSPKTFHFFTNYHIMFRFFAIIQHINLNELSYIAYAFPKFLGCPSKVMSFWQPLSGKVWLTYEWAQCHVNRWGECKQSASVNTVAVLA